MRLRLTLLYGALFAVSAAVVLVIVYVLVGNTLRDTPRRIQAELAERLGVAPGRGPNAGPGPGPGGPLLGDRDSPAIVRELQEQLRDDVLADLLRNSVFVFAGAAVVAFGAGWALAGRALRPVHAITEKARTISEQNLHSRLALDGPDDELREMADTFDALLERLDRAFESQRRFVASASHELRSPLTIMRAEAETPTGERDLAATVVAQVERADRLIEALLTLTRSQGTLVETELVDLPGLVGDVLSPLVPAADRADLDLQVHLADACVRGDPPLLERLIGNLVENAIRHNAAQGEVRVAAGTGDDGRPFVEVANTGPVVPADRVAELLEPFRRLQADRTGSGSGSGYGLGLAVVQAVAVAHGADLDVRARPAGGLVARVTFPVADPTPR